MGVCYASHFVEFTSIWLAFSLFLKFNIKCVAQRYHERFLNSNFMFHLSRTMVMVNSIFINLTRIYFQCNNVLILCFSSSITVWDRKNNNNNKLWIWLHGGQKCEFECVRNSVQIYSSNCLHLIYSCKNQKKKPRTKNQTKQKKLHRCESNWYWYWICIVDFVCGELCSDVNFETKCEFLFI